MDLKQLTYIVTIAQEQNLSRAAEKLYVSQSTLSLYLKKLEQELGIPLFTRRNNRLSITPAGKLYMQTAQELLEMEEGAGRHLYREPAVPEEVARYEPPVDLDELLAGLTLAKLKTVFESVMKRREDKIDPIRSRFGTIRKEPVSLEARVGWVMNYARGHRKFSFRQLLERQGDKVEIVVTFLAVLELMKMGKIYLTQEELFDDMNIETLEPEGQEEELDLEGLEDFEG